MEDHTGAVIGTETEFWEEESKQLLTQNAN
jgi:hypothetical protein